MRYPDISAATISAHLNGRNRHCPASSKRMLTADALGSVLGGFRSRGISSGVVAGLVPATPNFKAQSKNNRGGHDRERGQVLQPDLKPHYG